MDLKWISSFLSDMSQRLVLDGDFSYVAPVVYEVFPGLSIRSHLVFAVHRQPVGWSVLTNS